MINCLQEHFLLHFGKKKKKKKKTKKKQDSYGKPFISMIAILVM